jgi:hypothetical protein
MSAPRASSSLLGGELTRQAGMLGDQACRRLTVTLTTGAEQPVDRGPVVVGAVAHQQPGDVLAVKRRREPVGRAAVRAWRRGVGAVDKQQLDQLRRSLRDERLHEHRNSPAVAVAVAPRVGACVKQQLHRLHVARADRRAERHLGRLADVRDMAEQHSNAPTARKSRRIQIAVSHGRTTIEQQPDDRLVSPVGVRARHRTLQRRPTTVTAAAVRVGSGVEQQPRNGVQTLGAGRIQMPARRAHSVQRRPARPRIAPAHQPGVSVQRTLDPSHVAEYHGRRQTVLGDLGMLCEQPRCATGGPVADARGQKRLDHLAKLRVRACTSAFSAGQLAIPYSRAIASCAPASVTSPDTEPIRSSAPVSPLRAARTSSFACLRS